MGGWGNELVAKITALFSGPVSVGVASAEMYYEPLWPEESRVVARAVKRRRLEFSAGRAAARRALLALGLPPGPIPANTDRSPIWPSGYVGSISHCSDFCGAVAAKIEEIDGLGFDVELTEPLPEEIAELVYGRAEATKFSKLPPLRQSNWGKIAFSAKEAFYKCYYPKTKQILDFLDISVSFSIEELDTRGRFFIAPNNSSMKALNCAFVGRWQVVDGMIFTGATLRCLGSGNGNPTTQ